MKNITVTTSTYPDHKDITLLSVRGFIDTTTASEFERTFQSVLGEKKFNLIIDLKNVDYISSAGWGIFVGEIKRIRNQKGNLFLASMCPEVTEAYELLQFDTIIKAFPDVDQAVERGFGKPRSTKEPAKAPVAASSSPIAFPEPAAPAPVVAAQKPKSRGPFWILTPWKWF